MGGATMTDAETKTLRNRGVLIASKDQPCELMRITALPLQKGKVLAEMDEEETVSYTHLPLPTKRIV